MPRHESPPTGISTEDWAATPPAVRALVETLLERLARLEERLNRTSRNSSQPPSSDPPHATSRPPRAASGRKAGGQPGHPGHGREFKPAAQVDRIIEAKPNACEHCGALWLGDEPEPVRQQVTDLPRLAPIVTEYRCHTLCCLACGAETRGAGPQGMPAGGFGPRLQAAAGFLTGRIGASHREVQEVLATVFQAEVSVGSIAGLEQAVSEALAAPVAEAARYVQEHHVRNTDETGWREKAKRVWLWISTTPVVTVFRLLASRGAVGAKEVLGEDFPGVAGTDRYGAYNWIDPRQRHLCWAHLKREFIAWSERGGAAARRGHAWLAEEARLFALWYQVREGTLRWADFQVAMLPLMERVGTLLREAAAGAPTPTQRTWRNILKQEAALWTFVWEADVEPTNNSAERPLRRAVLWRRRSFGTQSVAGSQFVERILTAVTTLRQQQRDVLDYLTAVCQAALCGEKPPSLLPQPQGVHKH